MKIKLSELPNRYYNFSKVDQIGGYYSISLRDGSSYRCVVPKEQYDYVDSLINDIYCNGNILTVGGSRIVIPHKSDIYLIDTTDIVLNATQRDNLNIYVNWIMDIYAPFSSGYTKDITAGDYDNLEQLKKDYVLRYQPGYRNNIPPVNVLSEEEFDKEMEEKYGLRSTKRS